MYFCFERRSLEQYNLKQAFRERVGTYRGLRQIDGWAAPTPFTVPHAPPALGAKTLFRHQCSKILQFSPAAPLTMAVTAGQSSARPKFKFLMVSNEPKTARQRELEVTEIRTHAARISYRKKNTPPGGGTAARASHRSTTATGSFNSSTETSDAESDDSSSLIKLRTRLGGGWVDPFNSDSVPGLPAWILDLVDNAWTNAWCNLRSGRHDGLVHPDVYGWRQAGLSCPALVHAHISGAIGIALAQGAWADQSSHLHRTQIYHATLAINYVRKELGRCKASTSG